MSTTIISKDELLQHWLAHRNLTKKTIEKFPEKELFEFSIGGMRPFADLVKELLSLTTPGLKEIVTRETKPFNHDLPLHTKADLLQQWDKNTLKSSEYFNRISGEQFHETYKLFGQYEAKLFCKYHISFCPVRGLRMSTVRY